jgi:DNA-binding transcriptional regulator LsrR (DeoR family)
MIRNAFSECKCFVLSYSRFDGECEANLKLGAKESLKMAKTVAQPDVSLPQDRVAGRIARNRMRIAWMYYVEGLTQNEIAERLGIGRVTVVRNITEARKNNEVKILIQGEIAECIDLESQLKAAFGFDEAVVVPEPADAKNVSKVIGVAAGIYTTAQLRDNFVLGVGWGATLYQSLASLTPTNLSGVEVISLLGGIVAARRYNPAEFAWQFANTVGADCYLFTAPAVVDSAATREALIEKCGIGTVFAHARKADMALVSVGDISAASTSFRFGYLTEADRKSLIADGAVGDLLFNYFDLHGKIVENKINDRVMSVPVAQLRKVPKRVIASGGVEKVAALRGAIKLLDCNVLITNESTAIELLKQAG